MATFFTFVQKFTSTIIKEDAKTSRIHIQLTKSGYVQMNLAKTIFIIKEARRLNKPSYYLIKIRVFPKTEHLVTFSEKVGNRRQGTKKN